MIWFLNRKRLLLETDSTEVGRVKSLLQQNNIAYEEKTTVSDNAMSRTFNAKAAQRYVTAYDAAANQSYVYYLYVRRKDYTHAAEIIRK